jgi:MFS family permease
MIPYPPPGAPNRKASPAGSGPWTGAVRRREPSIGIVALGGASVWLNVTSLLPLLVDLGEAMGWSVDKVGLVTGAGALVPLVTGPLWGAAADRFDRRILIA